MFTPPRDPFSQLSIEFFVAQENLRDARDPLTRIVLLDEMKSLLYRMIDLVEHELADIKAEEGSPSAPRG